MSNRSASANLKFSLSRRRERAGGRGMAIVTPCVTPWRKACIP